jgi:hypothetical protein
MRDATLSPSPIDAYEEDLLKILDECVADIPHAGNGKPVAGNAYADQVLKEIRGGRSKEVRRIVAVLLGMLDRGAKRPGVRLFAQRLDAILARHGSTAEPRPIRLLNRRETREDGMFDLAQLRIEANPDDLESLTALVRQAAFYRAALDELIEEAHDRIVVLRSGACSGRRLALVVES